MRAEDERFERRIAELASGFRFPDAPDLKEQVLGVLGARASGVKWRPALGWAAAAALLLTVITLSLVPGARAALEEIVRIGSVRLLFGSDLDQELAGAPGIAASELDLAGETTLEEARRAFPHPIVLPAYPPQLGAPDRVFVQENPASAVVLVWLNDRRSVELALFQLTGPVFKWEPTVVEQTRVNDAPAVWTEGPYWVVVQSGEVEQRRLIEGHVLIWEQSGVTYRLETHLPLELARRIAESLRP